MVAKKMYLENSSIRTLSTANELNEEMKSRKRTEIKEPTRSLAEHHGSSKYIEGETVLKGFCVLLRDLYTFQRKTLCNKKRIVKRSRMKRDITIEIIDFKNAFSFGSKKQEGRNRSMVAHQDNLEKKR